MGLIDDEGATSNISAKTHRQWQPCFSERLYRGRHLIEQSIPRLKPFHRGTTQCQNWTATSSPVQLASICLWLRAYQPTAESQQTSSQQLTRSEEHTSELQSLMRSAYAV